MSRPIPMTPIPAPPIPSLWLSLIASAVIQALFLPAVMIDIAFYLIPWFDHIVAAGPVGAFAAPFSNYTPPYLYLLAIVSLAHDWVPALYLIKGLSIAGTLALAVAVHHLLGRLGVAHRSRWAALVFLLPTTSYNAALMGQCDAMWAAACVAALAAAIDRRHRTMLAWCGLAIAIKAQAVFFAPFILALLINRRVALAEWLIAPAMFAAAMLPAIVAGWQAGDIATIYLRQASTFPDLARNAPNIWLLVQSAGAPIAPLMVFAGLCAATATAAYVAHFARRPLDIDTLLSAALLAPLLLAGLLPKMHERYFFLADILALVLAARARDRNAWTIAYLVQAGSALAVFGAASAVAILSPLGAIAMIVASWLLLRRLGLVTVVRSVLPAGRTERSQPA